MTKREIIYSVFEKLKILTDDSDLTEEFISSLIDSKRAMLLKQQFGKSPWDMPLQAQQEICLTLEVADAIDGVTCFGKILRSKLKLPSSVKIRGKQGPLLVRKMDRMQISINIVPIERLPFLGHNQFLANQLYAAVDYDGKLYLFSNNSSHMFLSALKVTDVFEAPDDATEMSCDTEFSYIDPWDQDYPIESAMVDPLVNIIMQELTKTLSLPQDNVNDAEDARN